jgi:adenylate cyclase class IV
MKARCADLAAAEKAAGAVGARLAARLRQDDTYFRVPEGRLKLRSIGVESRGGEAGPDATGGPRQELIFYRRSDEAGPRRSDYTIHEITEDADGLRDLLGESLGIVARVVKTRTLYRLGPTRLHLDEVAGLGTFVEIERVLGAGEADAGARAEVERLAAALGVRDSDLVALSYADLIEHAPALAAGAVSRAPSRRAAV